MKTLMTGFFILLCIAITHAQSSLGKQVNDAKFQIVKKTAEFLSTDKATFGNKPKNKCDGCSNYDDIKKYAFDNSLTNVNTLVNELQNSAVDTASGKWKASLTSFRENVITKITTGSDSKIARKNLPGFQSYISSLNGIISNIKTTGSEQTASASQDENAATQKPESTAAKAGETVKKTNPSQPTMTDEETAPEASLVDKAMPWLPYIMAAVLLIALLIVWNAGKNHKANAMLFEKDRRNLSGDNEKLKKERSDLEKKNRQLEEDLKNKESEYQNLNKLLKAEKNRTKAQPETTEQEPLQIAAEKPAAKISVQKPKPVVANVKYARYADMGDGFSNAELLDKADGETIFELVIMPNNNTGEFKVASHAAAQHYALSNAQYFLGKTCQYNSFPSEDATIQTDAPGTIKLTGSKWTIVSPAKISFS